MGNGPDGLIVSQARHQPAIDDLENGSFRLNCGVGTLIENAPHMAVALRGGGGFGYFPPLLLSWAHSPPRREEVDLQPKGECTAGNSHGGVPLKIPEFSLLKLWPRRS